MDMKQIRALAEMMKANELTQVEIVEDGKTIHLERKPAAAPILSGTAAQTSAAVPPGETPYKESPQEGTIIESPMVGMYYAAPMPGAAPFVQAGSHVKKGDVLCIIEAMKTMNEITADCDGQILQIYAGNGQLVEVGQRLFLVGEES